jgi:hypothetical protein
MGNSNSDSVRSRNAILKEVLQPPRPKKSADNDKPDAKSE